MHHYKLEYTKTAVQDLKRLDKKMAQRIVKKLDFFANQKDPLAFAKRLKDRKYGEYRFRIGDYRAIFDIAEGKIKILLMLIIRHRREVYRDL